MRNRKSRDEFAEDVRQASEKIVSSASEFQKAMDAAFAKMAEDAKRVIIEILIEEFAQLQASTPVDTGRAQAGWLISSEGEAVSFSPKKNEETDSYEPQDASKIEGSLMKTDVVYVINNVEYVLYLEAGWSKLQPGGFIATFLANCKRKIEEACAAMSRAR